MIKNICIFGSYKPLEIDIIDIGLIGKILAENGYIIISGGFDGSMEQISKGAREAGGKTIGVTFYKFPDLKYHKANEFIDEEIITESIFERISKMIELADAFLVFPEGTGTLFEIASVIESINKGLIENKPIAFYGNYWKSIFESINDVKITNKKLMKQFGAIKIRDLVIFVHSIDSLLEFLKENDKM